MNQEKLEEKIKEIDELQIRRDFLAGLLAYYSKKEDLSIGLNRLGRSEKSKRFENILQDIDKNALFYKSQEELASFIVKGINSGSFCQQNKVIDAWKFLRKLSGDLR